MTEAKVSIVIPAFNAETTLRQTVESLQTQSFSMWEAIVVDDGSTDGTPALADALAATDRRVRVVHQPNAGEAAARNTGLWLAKCDWVVFLDSDDWLRPYYLSKMTDAVAANPDLDVVHCGWLRVTSDGRLSHEYFAPETQNLFPEFARYNCFAIHAAMVRRELVNSVGQFDVTLKTCPDWDLWQRVARTRPRFGAVREALACYRLRADSAGVEPRQLLTDALQVIARGHQADARVTNPAPEFAQGMPPEEAYLAKLGFLCWSAGLAIGRDHDATALLAMIPADRPVDISAELVADCIFSAAPLPRAELPAVWSVMWPNVEPAVDAFLNALEARTQSALALQAKLILLQKILWVTQRAQAVHNGVPFVRPFVTDPVSRAWGYERGLPVDRRYIERFLEEYAPDVHGRVLEVCDNAYTLRFGGHRVLQSDVVDVDAANPAATIIADLTNAAHIPDNTFDCIILTQTLQFIYDAPAAIRTAYRILKPGGVLLATVPGLTRTSATELPGSWFWRFTPSSAQRMFGAFFPQEQMQIRGQGNVFTASAFLYGMAAEEISRDNFDKQDDDYDVIVSVRAVKPDVPGMTINASRSESERAPALVLLYHRVSSHELDPWQISVTPERFSEQLSILREETRVVPLGRLMDEVVNGSDARPLVAITFDDGYADNLYAALPVLTQHALPASIFVCTGGIPGQAEFWWDTLERLLLWPNSLPQTLSVDLGGDPFDYDLGGDSQYTAESARVYEKWCAWDAAPTSRHALYAELWRRLHRMDARTRSDALRTLIHWTGEAALAPVRHRSLSPSELEQLAGSPLIEIGAHTVTHSSLATLPALSQQLEIASSRSWLEGLLGLSVTAFSYPFGKPIDYSTETVQLVRANGFSRACSNVAGMVQRGSDPHQLPRMHVPNWNGLEFGQQLRQWLAASAEQLIAK